jgi:hypothetical protein
LGRKPARGGNELFAWVRRDVHGAVQRVVAAMIAPFSVKA